MDNPTVYITFVASEMKRDSFVYKSLYKEAHECLSTLQLICNQIESYKNENNEHSMVSTADELRKFKQLMDDEIITKDEFEAIKKELLNL